MLTSREPFAKYCSAEDFAKIKEYDTVSQMWPDFERRKIFLFKAG